MKQISPETSFFQQIPSEFFLVIVLAILAAVLLSQKSIRSYARAHRRWSSSRNARRPGSVSVADFNAGRARATLQDMSDPKAQMEAISKVRFEKVRLLNKEEARLLPLLEAIAKNRGEGLRVMAQTSLGEVIRPLSDDKQKWSRANASINSKRLDFAIVDRWGMLAVAIEYQGSGHYHHDSFMRDAVKREALRKAGVPFVEIDKEASEDEVRAQVEKLLNEKPPFPNT